MHKKQPQKRLDDKLKK